MNVLRELRKFKTKSALAKIRILILLTVMLVVSTYAWFTYEKKVTTSGIMAKMTAWDVEYSINDEEITTEEIIIALEEFYPGMPDFEKKIKISNKTHIGVEIKYEIKSIKIFGEEKLDYLKANGYITEDGKTMNFFATEEIPFNAGFSFNKESLDGVKIDPDTGELLTDSVGDLIMFANWDYIREGAEKDINENDALDTLYGELAYNFYQDENLAEQYSPLEIVILVTSAREGYMPE